MILTSREGEAYGLASGLYLGGAVPLVLIQNTGFFEAGDAFRGTAFNMGLPIVMLLGYRGYKSMESGAPRVDTAATFFEPTLSKVFTVLLNVAVSSTNPVINTYTVRAENYYL